MYLLAVRYTSTNNKKKTNNKSGQILDAGPFNSTAATNQLR